MDKLLLTFIEATDEVEADHCLTNLIEEHAAPIVKEILSSTLRLHVEAGSAGPYSQDASDLFNDVILNLVSRLRQLKHDPAQDTIADFRSYVAGTAYNACNFYLRQKFPRRSRLKNRLRYLLSHDSHFALWPSEPSGLLCGLAKWRDKHEQASARLLEKIRQDPGEWIQTAGLKRVSIDRADLTALLNALFQWCQSPIKLDDLVNIVAVVCREKDQPNVPLEKALNLAATTVSFDTILEQQINLDLFWREICELPRRQRVALLLNFRDDRGQELASLLPYTRTATIEEIAGALEFPLAEFLELWNKLPLDDIAISQLLNATRQQVINLRKCARQRLQRRMSSVTAKMSAAK
jgi:RNA polymerase sigma factor (sigma-70 family)